MQEALHAEHTTHMHPTSYNPLFNILIINIYQSSETGNSTWYVDGVRIYNAYLSTYNYPLEPSGYKTGCQLSSTIVTGHEHEPDHEKVIRCSLIVNTLIIKRGEKSLASLPSVFGEYVRHFSQAVSSIRTTKLQSVQGTRSWLQN